jgi:DNA polymerase (family 10)
MKNAELAQLFDKTADVLAIKGENSFRVNAYRRVARTLTELGEDVETLLNDGRLAETPGIGESSVSKVREYLKTGHIAELEELWSEVPAGVLELLQVPNLGPKTAALLWHEQGIASVEQLRKALDQPDFGSLTEIAGLGAKKLEKIKQSLAFLTTSSGRVSIAEALPLAEELVSYLRALPGVTQAQYCGSLRRGRETIGDIDIALAAESSHGAAISKAVTQHPSTAAVIGAGPTKTSIRTADGVQVDVRVLPPESWGAALLYFTGSKEHNIRLRELAISKGLKLSEWGLFKGEESIASRTEEEIYAALDLAWIPPEMREDRGELDLFHKLHTASPGHAKHAGQKADGGAWRSLEISDLQGDLHMHTRASDGTRSIEEMVAECKRRGFKYLAITDHSKSSFQANGLRVDRLLEHIAAIHAVAREAAKSDMLVLAGSEVDILADGSLDYEDDVLAKLDWVVASPHAALTQEADAATARLVRVCANPYVHVVGHPTGRIVPNRRGLEPDMAKVVFAAARHGVALELNAHHARLDLRDTHLKLARDAGVPVCINCDAHGFEDFGELRYGILTARRGWLRREDVLNARPLEAFRRWLEDRKHQASW